MAQVEFKYNGVNTTIQCLENQKFFEICNAFIIKSHLNENEINYFYDGKGGSQFDKNLTFNEMANSLDKERKKMNVLVIANEQEDDKKLVRAKNIICPECGEDIKMKIEEFKINLFDCKNKHKIKNISLHEIENKQKLDLVKIKCGFCKENNKANVYNNEFYKCYECNKNICPLCKLKHDKGHSIINYDKRNYICNKHEETLINYCKDCKANICQSCEKEHIKHEMISLRDMIIDKKELLIKLDNLKKPINLFNDKINKIIEIANIVKINIEKFYKFSEYIINNYNQKERNYEILHNINEIINNNITSDIYNINNDSFNNTFKNIFHLYTKLFNEIKLTIKIKENDINKKIFFLDNTVGDIYINGKWEKHNHDFLKELNESNTELYINNKKQKYEKYFIPDKEGEYYIKLKFNILMKDCSCMFYNCNNIINIDLSLFNTKKVNDMKGMFALCSNLKNIDFYSFNTQNINNMERMFYYCSNLKNLDLSSFNTQNVKDMSNMFAFCSNLLNINLSSFNTKSVYNMKNMFYYCSNLKNIDLSSFNTKNVTNMFCMFEYCSNLKNIDLSSFNTKNVKDMAEMFCGCYNLKNIDLSSFNTQNVINMYGMFYYCSNLKNIDLSSFNTKNVSNMYCLFAFCSKLEYLDISSFITINVETMERMFLYCSKLENIDLSTFDTRNVYNMAEMFHYCSNLKNLDLSTFDTRNISYIGHMFSGCDNLKEIKMCKNDYAKIEDKIDGDIENIIKLNECIY